MDLSIHNVSKVELGNIRQYDDYETRDITITSKDGDVTITLFSIKGQDEGILKVQA